jgi:hypothetical protein
MPASFKLNNTLPSSIKNTYIDNTKNIIKNTTFFNDLVGEKYEILGGSQNKLAKSKYLNGFVGLMIEAYDNHYKVVIRPDDVWICLLTQFSKYINANAEELRNKFVNHEDKKTLAVMFNCSMRSVPYDVFIEKINVLINKNLNESIADWITCNFSTSTKNDEIVSKSLLMTTLKEYFTYTLMCRCGIPNVTLLGNIEDWQLLKSKVEKFIEYDNSNKLMTSWTKNLLPIMDKFIESFTNPDINWWNSVRLISQVSGSSIISGWIKEFMRFQNDGKYKNDDFGNFTTTNIPISVSDTPIKIIDIDDTQYDAILFAGSFGYSKTTEGYAVSNDWIVSLKF